MAPYQIRFATKEDFGFLVPLHMEATLRHDPVRDQEELAQDAKEAARMGLGHIQDGTGNTLVLFDENTHSIHAYLSYLEAISGDITLRGLYARQSENHYGLKLWRHFLVGCKDKGVKKIRAAPEPYMRNMLTRGGFRQATLDEIGGDPGEEEEYASENWPMILELT